MSGWWCGACGQPYDLKEQVVFLAYGAPDGDCDNMISVLTLVTNLMK